MATPTLADAMLAFYELELGKQGNLIDLEREYFGALDNQTWADSALLYFATANGSIPGSANMMDEAFKYYSNLSGLNPAQQYSLADHMYYVFATLGGPPVGTGQFPPIVTGLELYLSSLNPVAEVYKPNLLTANQASVETDTTGFLADQNCTIARIVGQAAPDAGTASLQVTSTNGAVLIIASVLKGLSGVPVVPNQTYSASVAVKSGGNTASIIIQLQWYDGAGAVISTPASTNIPSSPTVWTTYRISALAPSNAAFAAVRVRWTAVGTGEVMYMDKWGLWQGQDTDWRMPLPTGDYRYHTTINLLTANQASVETNTAGFSAQGAAVISRDTTQAFNGSASLKAVCTGAFQGATTTNNISLTVDKTYTAVAMVRQTVAGNIRGVVFDGANGYKTAGGDNGVSGIAINTWTQITWTFVALSTVTNAQLIIDTGTTGRTVDIFMDSFGIWEGTDTIWRMPGDAAAQDGIAISKWRDQSGNGRDAVQATIANQPLFRTANRNLLTYNGATLETDTSGWAVSANCNISRVTTPTLGGGGSLSMAPITGGIAFADVRNGTLGTPIVPGRTYTAVLYMRASTVTDTCFLNVEFIRNDGSGIFLNYSSPNIVDSNTGWTFYTVTMVAPPDGAFVLVKAVSLNGIGVHFVDNIGIWEGTRTDWVAPVTLPDGLPTLQFDGLNDVVQSLGMPIGTSPLTVYVVANIDGNRVTQCFMGNNNGGAFNFFYADLAGLIAFNRGAPNYAAGGPLGPPALFVAVSNDPNTLLSINGNATGANLISGTTAMTTAVIGASSLGGSLPFLGSIAAVLVYSGAHTDTQRKQMEAWLGERYGIAITP